MCSALDSKQCKDTTEARADILTPYYLNTISNFKVVYDITLNSKIIKNS